MRIDFKRFKRYKRLDKSVFEIRDVREMFGNLIYEELGYGFADKRLAEKIHDSDENTLFSEEEVDRIRQFAASVNCWFMDGLEEAIKKED